MKEKGFSVSARRVTIGSAAMGGGHPLALLAGPCVIESEDLTLRIAEKLAAITREMDVPLVFKASYDKANRTSLRSYRGPGLDEGLRILSRVKKEIGVPVLSDVHAVGEIAPAAEVLDCLQIPAFLCRQTDLVVAAARTRRPLNIKKGQFLAPWDMASVIEKITAQGNEQVLLTERGTSFGYNTLVTDMRSLAQMRALGFPVVMDATHSVQQPGGLGSVSGGQAEFIPLMARCGVAAGCDAVFMEVHEDPSEALSDGPNMLPLSGVRSVLGDLKALDDVMRSRKLRE